MSKWFTVSVGIITLVIGIGIGYTLTPSYGQQDAMTEGSVGPTATSTFATSTR